MYGTAHLAQKCPNNSLSRAISHCLLPHCVQARLPAPTSRPRFEEFSSTTSSSSTFEGTPDAQSPRYGCSPRRTHPTRPTPHAPPLPQLPRPCAFGADEPLSGSVFTPGSSILRRGDGEGCTLRRPRTLRGRKCPEMFCVRAVSCSCGGRSHPLPLPPARPHGPACASCVRSEAC